MKNVLEIKNEIFQYFILNLRPKLNAGLILMESYKKNKLKLKYKKFKWDINIEVKKIVLLFINKIIIIIF